MYTQIIDELNTFLESLNINGNLLNPNEFQAVLVKKLSNPNIPREHRRIPADDVNQTHIDITGRNGKLFFFEELSAETTTPQSIDIDLYANNYRYLQELNNLHMQIIDDDNYTVFIRSMLMNPNLNVNNEIVYSSAAKKYGHGGDQVQINMADANETFYRFHKFTYMDDALVMLRYDYDHYLALIIPTSLCTRLYDLASIVPKKKVNSVIPNPSYNANHAAVVQEHRLLADCNTQMENAAALQASLLASHTAGRDTERTVKARVAQGAFRRLLFRSQGCQCRLCNIATEPVLRASHIKEWSVSSREERMDSENGLLLCATHDALFDRHLISFRPDTGELCISATINEEQRDALNLQNGYRIALSEGMRHYMNIHCKQFRKNEK